MSIEPTYSGEVQFRRYSDTSTQGQMIVLQLADREALKPFIGLEGKRFMAVLVAIGDDELPIPPPTPRKQKQGPILTWLVMRCKEQAFRDWLTVRGDFAEPLTEESAAEVVRGWLYVNSRTEIDGNAKAEALFDKLIRKPWMKALAQREQDSKAMARQPELNR